MAVDLNFGRCTVPAGHAIIPSEYIARTVTVSLLELGGMITVCPLRMRQLDEASERRW